MFIRNLLSRKNTYFIADTHFDHGNIIRYCHRPFPTVDGMNRTLVKNWNSTVEDGATVYFLGDWAFGRECKPASYWTSILNGRIISIRGSHDSLQRGMRFYTHKVLHIDKYKFLLIHDPYKRPTDWEGWVIHGHKHNKCPFIDGVSKTINVSVEVINYTSISLDSLLCLNIDSIKSMWTIDSEPERRQGHSENAADLRLYCAPNLAHTDFVKEDVR